MKSSENSDESLRRQLAAIPGFSEGAVQSAHFTRLVGMNNRVYRVDLDNAPSVCLRIPGRGVAAAVDRRAEEVNARLAAKAGVAPEVLYFGEDGVMLTRFIEDAAPLRPERIRESRGALERGAVALRRLHHAVIAFAGTFRAFETIDAYAAALQRLGAPPSGSEQATLGAMQAVRSALAERPATPKPCHCDPTGRNLLDTGEKVWLVDWEYSGMNDPTWDLAYFSIESQLDDARDHALLTAYYGRAPAAAEAARMAVMKPVCEVQAALWALIQGAEGNPGGDFGGYARTAFARAAERLRAAEFSQQLEAVRKS